MMRSWIVVSVVVATACGSGSEAAPAGAAAGGAGGGAGGAGLAAAVETANVSTGRIAREVSVTGVVEPIRSVAVNSQMAGALRSVGVEEGARVAAGTVIARIDDRELAAQVASAEAAHTVASAAYERSNRLRDRQVITMAEYERDRAAFDAAAAQLEQLRTRLDFATIRAPVSGVVTEKRVEAGDAVGAQTHLFTIADVSVLVVQVQVSELDVVQLESGQPAAVMMDAFPGRRFNGRIRRIFPSADPATRLVPVEVALDAESASVARPGFLARVAFALEPRDGVRLVPASAVVGSGAAQAVFVVEDGRAVRRPVQTGISSAGNVEVIAGLEVGERIVIAGVNTLRDGAAVREVSGAPTRATAPPESATFQPPRNGGGV